MSRTPDPASRPKMKPSYLIRFLRRNLPGWDWDFPFPGGSSRIMAVIFGSPKQVQKAVLLKSFCRPWRRVTALSGQPPLPGVEGVVRGTCSPVVRCGTSRVWPCGRSGSKSEVQARNRERRLRPYPCADVLDLARFELSASEDPSGSTSRPFPTPAALFAVVIKPWPTSCRQCVARWRSRPANIFGCVTQSENECHRRGIRTSPFRSLSTSNRRMLC